MTVGDLFAIFCAFLAVCAIVGAIYFWFDNRRWDDDLAEARKHLQYLERLKKEEDNRA